MKPRLELTRPTRKDPIAEAARLTGGIARLVVDMPTELHRAVKIKAIERGQTVRDYVLELLRADGIE